MQEPALNPYCFGEIKLSFKYVMYLMSNCQTRKYEPKNESRARQSPTPTYCTLAYL